MATDLGKTKLTRTAAGAKHDAFVQAQLTRAEKRIRLLDVAAALLGFAALLCVFLVTAALCDHAWSLPAWVRQLGLAGFLVGGGVYLVVTLGRPLRYRVNPYYAAQLVEHTMPGAKNSVVNWLDLQQQQLPPAIHAAVGQKAARDLSKTDIDRAFSVRRVFWAGVLAAACTAVFLICFVRAGSGSFFRVVAPFSFGSADPRTRITLTQPADGDDTVTIDHAVFIAARVAGKLPDPNGPDAIRVLYRYQPGDPYQTPLVMRLDGDEYKAIISKSALGEGFWYKIVAGNAETPEYHITVRSRPLLTKVEATYHFRPYVGRLDELHFARRTFKMETLRGTEITLAVRTNRPVQSAALVLEDADGTKERIAAVTTEDNPNAFTVKLLTDRTARYHLEYTTPEGESYDDLNPRELVAQPDQPPATVTLTAPARDTQLPCNGVLQVEGAATDDVGVKSLTLRLREVTQKFDLQGKPYRSDAELRFSTGGYALQLAYKDFVDLNTVTTPDGKLLALQKDMVLEYWLEARDACDYPQPNPTVESKHYRVTLLAPEKDQEKFKDDREQAQRDQQQHETKQSETLRKQAAQRFEKQQRDNQNDESNPPENPTDSKKPSDSAQGEKSGNQEKADQKTMKEAADLEAALQKEKERQKNKSAAKGGPEQQAPAQAKDSGQGEKKPPQPGQAKPRDGKPENRQDAGENKPAGQQSEPQNAPAEAKADDKSNPSQKPAVNKPDSSPQPEAPKSQGKEMAAPPPEQPAEAKSAPTPRQKKESGQDKPDAKPNSQECTRADCKNGGVTANPNAHHAETKPQPAPRPNAAEGKNAGPGQHGDDPKAQQKPGADPASASSKSAPPKEIDPGEAKKGATAGAATDPRKATPDDVADAAQDLKSPDPQQREDAAKQLEEIAKKADDPQTRQQAQEKMEDAGLKPTEPSRAKGPPKAGPKGQSTEQASESKGSQGEKEGLGKAKDGGDDKELRSTPKDLGKPPLQDKVPELDDAQKKELDQRREEYLKKLEQDQKRKGEFDEQKWRDFLKEHKEELNPPELTTPKGRQTSSEPAVGAKSDEPPQIKNGEHREQKASMLQLRKFLQAVDPKVLKEAGMSEEQWRAFLKNYADRALREEQKKETLPPPAVGTMQGTGGQRVNPGAANDPNAPSAGGRTQAPPGYRDAWKQFTRDLSSTDDKK